MAQIAALFCAVFVVAALLNWEEAKLVGVAFWGGAVSASVPVWLALQKAAPAVLDAVSKPLNILLYLIAFGGLVRYPHVLTSILAAMTGKAQTLVVTPT